MCSTVCKINVHKRCERNVANDCGIDKRGMAQIMKELGISGDKLSSRGKKVLAQVKVQTPIRLDLDYFRLCFYTTKKALNLLTL